jgi:hypothetical protein
MTNNLSQTFLLQILLTLNIDLQQSYETNTIQVKFVFIIHATYKRISKIKPNKMFNRNDYYFVTLGVLLK